MPEVDQYTFNYKELTEALVKQAGLHDGKWQVVFSFGLAAMNMGPSPAEVVPGAIVAVQSIGLRRAEPGSPETLVVDAASVNPASTEKQPPSSQSRSAERKKQATGQAEHQKHSGG